MYIFVDWTASWCTGNHGGIVPEFFGVLECN